MADGWIKLHRAIWENPVVTKDSDHFILWIWLLTNANFKEIEASVGGEIITLHPGQLVTGRKKISQQTGVQESKVERVLKAFEKAQQIEQQTNSRNRVISICSWEKYQQVEQQNEQRMNNKRTTSEQQVNTYKERKNIRKQERKNIYYSDDNIDDLFAGTNPDILRRVDEAMKEIGK